MKVDHQVAVIGAGTVGAALALALARAGVSVLLVEREAPKPPARRDEMDLRVSALSIASENILNSLGVWEEIKAVRACPYRHMEVWDAGGGGSLEFHSVEAGEPRLGHIVENRLARGVLWASLARHPRVTLACPSALEAFTVAEDGVQIELEDGTRKSVALLVGADGGRSKVREDAGIPSRIWDYRQRAVVTHVATGKPHQFTCYQRFLATGPLAFLPLADGRSSIVWSTTPEEAERLLGLEDDAFAAELTEAGESKLGTISRVGKRAAFPLRYQHARRYVQQRIALVGDAAHVVHPLAGQGVNLGLLDAAALAEVVVSAHRARRDIGRVSELRPYERWRKGDDLIMGNVLHGLKYLFGSDKRTVSWARNLGMNVVDDLKPIKKLFMRQAAGLAGDLPKLAVGQPL